MIVISIFRYLLKSKCLIALHLIITVRQPRRVTPPAAPKPRMPAILGWVLLPVPSPDKGGGSSKRPAVTPCGARQLCQEYN